MKLLIDGDVVRYRCGFAAQKTHYYVNQDLEVADGQIMNVTINEFDNAKDCNAWMEGKSIRELQLMRRADVIVVSILSAGDDSPRLFNPPPDTVVTREDKLLVVARSGARDRLASLESA